VLVAARAERLAPAAACPDALAIRFPAAAAVPMPLRTPASALSIKPAEPSWSASPEGIAAVI
jgi:hypothetical protein